MRWKMFVYKELVIGEREEMKASDASILNINNTY